MTTEYTPDDVLNDFMLIEAVLGDKERPEGGRVDLACNRLEEYLTGLLNTAKAVPPACGYCFNFSPADERCLSAEAPHRDPCKNFGVNGCPWFVERLALDVDTIATVPPGGGI